MKKGYHDVDEFYPNDKNIKTDGAQAKSGRTVDYVPLKNKQILRLQLGLKQSSADTHKWEAYGVYGYSENANINIPEKTKIIGIEIEVDTTELGT